MDTRLFQEFLVSGDTLQVYEGSQRIFASGKDRLLPLLEYIDSFSPTSRKVVILDKIVGNAAALLSILANCQEVHSPLGSQLAIATLDEYGIRHHFTVVVPYILQHTGNAMCPMEKLSMNKKPEEFYEAVRSVTGYVKEATN
ncbi:MAG: DUF1893 domain-containing protein [Planctomycetota bacterium]